MVIVKKDLISVDVIAVIVKRGNIRGKTMGEVGILNKKIEKTYNSISEEIPKNIEEIINQTKQAVSIPAELKSIFKSLPISRILIVVAGNISKNAKEIMRAELKNIYNIVDIKDIDWLVDNFTNFYPYIFFQGEILEFILNKIDNLEKQHWLQQKNVSLSKYFVEPLVKKMDRSFKIEDLPKLLTEKETKFNISKLKSLLKDNRMIILAGEPGVGKSIALVKIALDIYKTASSLKKGYVIDQKEKTKLPLLVHSREIYNSISVDELLSKEFSKQSLFDNVSIEVLLVDSLDEIEVDKREKVLEKVEKYSSILKCPVIVTSRKIDSIKSPKSGFTKYELLPFKISQSIKLCENLVKNNEKLKLLKDGLERIKYQIPLIPLSLLLLINIVEENKEIPASITEIYQRYFELMMGRWDANKGMEVIYDYHIKDAFISELAYAMFYKKNQFQLEVNSFNKFIDEYSQKYGWDQGKFNNFIKEISRSGIFTVNSVVEFKHRTFLDYFIAKYIFDNRATFNNLSEYLTNIYFDPIWSEIVFYFIGLHRKIEKKELLEKIFEFKDSNLSSFIDKFMVGRLVQAGWHSTKDIKKYGLENAIKYEGMIKNQLMRIINKEKRTPTIISDFFILALSEISFCSRFITTEMESIFYEILNDINEKNVFQPVIILWICNNYIETNKIEKMKLDFYEKLDNNKSICKERKIETLISFMILTKEDKSLKKVINRKLLKMQKSNPEIFKKLLPPSKDGFR